MFEQIFLLTSVHVEIDGLFNFPAEGVVFVIGFIAGALPLELVRGVVVGATLIIVTVALVTLN